jgi:GNAT superfamily N-acetyltransferase
VIVEETEAVQSIRRATPADGPALARVINRAYQVEEFSIHGPRALMSPTAKAVCQPERELSLSMMISPQLAGAVYVELRGDRGYFGLLSVDPDRQKRGLGKKLVQAAEARCRSAGCTHLDLDTVNVRLELPAFYRLSASRRSALLHSPRA